MSAVEPHTDQDRKILVSCEQVESDALFVNDLKALASQLNDKMLEAQQRGFKVDLKIKATWKTDENYLRERIQLTVWREVC
jgi:hypothetical protein